MNRHTDSRFEDDLDALGTHFARMGALARGMLDQSVRALLEGDAEAARGVVVRDADLDRLEKETDRLAVQILARRSPVGPDLRFLVAVMKCVTEVERIGDLAVNVSERSLDLIATPGVEPGPDAERLARGAIALFDRALVAFQVRDSPAARTLYEADRALDEDNRLAFSRLVAIVRNHPDQLDRALSISSACRNLERVGDHAVNIGERIVFMVEGEDVRHRHGKPKS